MSNDRSKALEAALGQIDRQFGKGSIMRLGDNQTMDIASVSTGSLGDYGNKPTNLGAMLIFSR